ncbi:MAG TPA: hypothetical protein ENN80_03665, partial [Candidatus Hydrogenedentes bacterium]|nr:hypothetical protein [Candidatus Hydrogenedentota bacterium]
MNRRWFAPLLAAAVLAGGCAGVAPDGAKADDEMKQKERRSMTITPAEQNPEQFARRVAAQGGRVDFVFEDDRPFKECHASTVAELPNGELVCAWFGGTEEKDPDVGIWTSRLAEGVWTYPERTVKVCEKAHWNPVLFRDVEGAVYLFFKVGVDVPQWQTYWMKTTDNARTWSEPVELVPGDIGGRGPVKNKPIILSDGTWLAPASTELAKWKPSSDMYDVGWRPFVDRSEDRGATWK